MTEIAKLRKKLQEAGDVALPLSKGKGQTAACTFVLLGDKAEGWLFDCLAAFSGDGPLPGWPAKVAG